MSKGCNLTRKSGSPCLESTLIFRWDLFFISTLSIFHSSFGSILKAIKRFVYWYSCLCLAIIISLGVYASVCLFPLSHAHTHVSLSLYFSPTASLFNTTSKSQMTFKSCIGKSKISCLAPNQNATLENNWKQVKQIIFNHIKKPCKLYCVLAEHRILTVSVIYHLKGIVHLSHWSFQISFVLHLF